MARWTGPFFFFACLLLVRPWSPCRAEEGRLFGRSVTEVQLKYVPQDLDAALRRLEEILDPVVLKSMASEPERGMLGYHRSLGLDLRNGWGLWKGSRLSKWFNGKGIHHPDDMSAIVLTSLWRRLHLEPLRLDEQVNYYQDYWRREKERGKLEQKRSRRVIEILPSWMMGLKWKAASPQILTLPAHGLEDMRSRFTAPFAGGVLLGVRQPFGAVFDDVWCLRPYFLDLKTGAVRPVVVDGIQQIRYTVVVGSQAYIGGSTNGRPVLVATDGLHRKRLSVPTSELAFVLGADQQRLLLVDSRRVYRLDGNEWHQLYEGTKDLPWSGIPPRGAGRFIYLRDEGLGENDKRLWWLDVGASRRLASFDNDVGVVGSLGPRWENNYSYTIDPEGQLWVTAGGGIQATTLLKRDLKGKYSIAVFNDRLQMKLTGPDDLLEGGSEIAVTGVRALSDGSVLAAGGKGLYRISQRQIEPLVRFANTKQLIPTDDGHQYHWEWEPTDILPLADGSYLLSATFGGVYLLRKLAGGGYQLESLDDRPRGAPLRL